MNMNLKIILICFLCMITHKAVSQSNQEVSTSRQRYYTFLYVLKQLNKKPIATENASPDPQQIDDDETLSDSSSSSLCRMLKVDYIRVLTLKPNTKLLTLSEVFDLYKIDARYRKLPVKLESTPILNFPESLLISKNQIESVKVIKSNKGNYILITRTGTEELKKEIEFARKRGIKPVD
jgi:hypothetical protein